MARIPPDVLAALERNHRRQQRGGVVEAAVGVGLGVAGLAGTIYRSHNNWYGDQSPSKASKRLRETLDQHGKAQKRLRTETDTKPNVWEHSKQKVSLPDSTSTAQVVMNGGGGEGSGNAQGTKETPIDDPFVVYRGPPDFTFASLPFIREEFPNLVDYYAADWIYRLTSPYDCTHEVTTTDLNAGAGTATVSSESESSVRTARWFDYYAGLYKYYHTVACR